MKLQCVKSPQGEMYIRKSDLAAWLLNLENDYRKIENVNTKELADERANFLGELRGCIERIEDL